MVEVKDDNSKSRCAEEDGEKNEAFEFESGV